MDFVLSLQDLGFGAAKYRDSCFAEVYNPMTMTAGKVSSHASCSCLEPCRRSLC